MKPPPPNPHAEIINGLMQLASYLTDNPGMPAPSDVTVSWLMGGEDSQRVAGVREIARQWDVDPIWDEEGTQMWAYWRFPGVTFAAVAQVRPHEAAPAQTEVLPLVEVPEVNCPTCLGNGASDYGTCPICLGKGRVVAWTAETEATW